MNIYEKRCKDWRYGPVVYQIFVDRFAESDDIEQKKPLYNYPRTLRTWNELPTPGSFMEDAKYWSHELDFWGGDLKSLLTKMDYIKSLDVDVLYLNPIVESLSNHKYDASDYLNISREYGTKKDLDRVISKSHDMNMKIMLDGVFNHMGIQAPMFQDALKNPHSPYRHFFDFNDTYPQGVRMWVDTKSLVELNLEEEKVQRYLYKDDTSVIQSYLRRGVDGWRLDVAFDIGYQYLKEITEAAHQVHPENAIVGELPNFPKKWLNSVDGVMNFTFRELILRLVRAEIPAPKVAQMFQSVVDESGIEGILKSWIIIDNHDTPRMTYELKTWQQQRLGWVLLMTLPGAPNIYYGTELGMNGGIDPENRAPMAWELVNKDNHVLQTFHALNDIRQSHIALKVGDFKVLEFNHFFGFIRYTDETKAMVFVVINPTDSVIKDTAMIHHSDIMNFSKFDLLYGQYTHIQVTASLLDITLNPYEAAIFKLHMTVDESYTPYKRI